MKKSIYFAIALALTTSAASAQSIDGLGVGDIGSMFPPSDLSQGVDGDAVNAFYRCVFSFGKKDKCAEWQRIEAAGIAKRAADNAGLHQVLHQGP